MKRKIIKIDEEKCNGCGECITSCAEGALKLVNGKAKLVKERYCDGFGDCIGECPTGALTIEEREAEDFDFSEVFSHVESEQGHGGITRLLDAKRRHEDAPAFLRPNTRQADQRGCPGSRMRILQPDPASAPPAHHAPGPSALSHWPIQIHLVQPQAPFFKNREMVVMSTCAPIASAETHPRFIRGRSVVVGCPKLDRTDGYAEKLALILQEPSIPKVIVVRMEVPCCGGLTAIAAQAARLSGRRDLIVEEAMVSVQGELLLQTPLDLTC